MQSGGWIALLRLIPQAQHENIVLTTTGGSEIAIQGLGRLPASKYFQAWQASRAGSGHEWSATAP